MNISGTLFDICRNISWYLTIALVIVICYNILGFVLGLDYPGKSRKTLATSFVILVVMLMLDNFVYTTYHVHLINTHVALFAPPAPIF